MDFIQQFSNWTKGDLIQAKLMIAGIIIFCVPLIFYSTKTSDVFFKGLIIPLSILSLMLLSYGGYLLVTKGKEIQRVEKEYSKNHQLTLTKEYIKAKKDSKSYVIFKTIWVSLFILSIFLYLLFDSCYMKGLSFGFIILFLVLFMTDTFFHARSKTYLSFIQESSRIN
ncbi:hypothetical protein [Chryseobacterium paludis]|uniref:hypothetical protein n=1 Tax=Chryseobacterium paludis TaxID=2956784 RepID=UPI0021BEC167|nr:hypothetical protein [Chryseobacterium paludis]